MTKVIDSHALLTFLQKEPGYEKIEKLFVEAVQKDRSLLMSCVNFGEVFYIAMRECGQEQADKIEKVIKTLPIEIVDVDMQISKEAARFKAHNKISYADCFSAALAKLHKGEVITGDKEFKALESEIKIMWI